MAVENLKSIPITALDTLPKIDNIAGQGASGYVRQQGAYISPSTAASVASTYRLIRINTNVQVKHLLLESSADTNGTVSVGLAYSDAPLFGITDGTPAALAGTVVAGNGVNFFATSFSLATATNEPTDIVNQSTNYPPSARNLPIWQAVGLASDPGGFFDILLTVTAAIQATGLLGVEVEYAF